MSGRTSIAAWSGLALGGVVLGVVVGLLNRVVAPALEISRYAEHILESGVAIAGNLDGTSELARTRAVATTAPGLALAYLDHLGQAPE